MRVGAGSEGVFDLELLNKEERKVAVDVLHKGAKPRKFKSFRKLWAIVCCLILMRAIAIVDMVNNRGNFVRISGGLCRSDGDIVYKRAEFLPNDNVKLISHKLKYGDIYPHKEGYDREILVLVCGKYIMRCIRGLPFNDYG